MLRGSGGDLPVSPDDEVVIVTDTFPGDDYRVMEFEFDVNPDDDGDDEPTIVTVTFRLTNGTDVLVIREVSSHGRIRIEFINPGVLKVLNCYLYLIVKFKQCLIIIL